MYTGVFSKALQKQWPRKRKWSVLEDNDPTGFKSRAGIEAKAEAKIDVFKIPPRSPDLNVCDYALWKEINKRMRRQELCWSASRRETRQQYLAFLARTARRPPAQLITDSIGDVVRRCERLYKAKGGYFEEGGK